MGKVSIIVPIYKAEKYLYKCLDSILAQTYTDFEAILVDDGSPDGSGKICDEYASKDSRFKVIHQPNGGVSVARQTGLDATKGEYVIHVDPDDWIEANMLDELVAKIEAENADMVFCDFWEEKENSVNYVKQLDKSRISSGELIERYFTDGSHTWPVLWDKLYKKSCLNNISFTPNMSLGEDMLFNLYVLCNGINISYLPKALYHYRKNTNSLTSSFTSKWIESTFLFINKLIDLSSDKSIIKVEYIHKIKKDLLFRFLLYRQYDLLKSSFPEIHQEIINVGTPYRWYMPKICCLAIALKGYVNVAYIVYKLNIGIIKLVKYFKSKL